MSLPTLSEYFLGHCEQDLDEALELLSQCVNDGHASLPGRLQVTCIWLILRGTPNTLQSPQHTRVLSFLQDTVLFAPTLQSRRVTLSVFDHTHRMPLDYASYQFDLGQLEHGIETLRRRKAALWSEMRYLELQSIDSRRQTHNY